MFLISDEEDQLVRSVKRLRVSAKFYKEAYHRINDKLSGHPKPPQSLFDSLTESRYAWDDADLAFKKTTELLRRYRVTKAEETRIQEVRDQRAEWNF